MKSPTGKRASALPRKPQNTLKTFSCAFPTKFPCDEIFFTAMHNDHFVVTAAQHTALKNHSEMLVSTHIHKQVCS